MIGGIAFRHHASISMLGTGGSGSGVEVPTRLADSALCRAYHPLRAGPEPVRHPTDARLIDAATKPTAEPECRVSAALQTRFRGAVKGNS